MSVATAFEWVNVHNQPIEGKYEGTRSGEGDKKGMYLRGRLESQIRVGVIPEVAGARELVCMKNFGVIGRVQTSSIQTAHIVPFEGHFERLEDCSLLFTRRGGGGGGGGAGKLQRAVFLVRSEGHPPGA